MLSKLIKLLLRIRLKLHPDWLGTSYSIDDTTDIHVLVETWRDGKHYYGIHEDNDEDQRI